MRILFSWLPGSLLLVLCLLGSSGTAYSCGGGSNIAGPTFCVDGVDPTPLAEYVATVNFGETCSGKREDTWTVTGGTFVDGNGNAIRTEIGSGNPLSGGSIIFSVKACGPSTPEEPCFTVPLGNTVNNNVFINWDPDAPLQELKVKTKLKDSPLICELESKIVVKRNQPVIGITTPQNPRNCSQREFTAQLDPNDCRAPTSFNWYRNGTFVGTSSGPTRILTVSQNTDDQITVEAVYGNSTAAAFTATSPRIRNFPTSMTGPTIAPDEGRPYNFSLNFFPIPGTSTQWQVSSNNVSITSSNTRSATVVINNLVNGSTFTVSAGVTICGQTRWVSRTVTMDANCTGRFCNPVLAGEEDGMSDGLDSGDLTLASVAADFKLYPNPVSSGAIATLTGLPASYELTLRNITGQVLRLEKGSSPSYRLATGTLPTGIYLLSVRDLDLGSPAVTHRLVIR